MVSANSIAVIPTIIESCCMIQKLKCYGNVCTYNFRIKMVFNTKEWMYVFGKAQFVIGLESPVG